MSDPTMSGDPAIEAAQRAYEPKLFARPGIIPAMQAADREMAKSVQELHRPFKAYPDNEIQQRRRRLNRDPLAKLRTGKVELPPQIRCSSCNDEEGDAVEWPCDTAKRVYPSGELER